MHDRIVSWLGSQTWPDLLDRIVTDRDVVAYEHPYGFVVVRLSSTAFAGWQIRVHIWPTRSEIEQKQLANNTADQQIHMHGWDIYSAVVLGAITENTYRVHPGTGNMYEVRSTFGIGDSKLLLSSSGIACDLVASRDRVPGETTYHIPSRQFHSSSPADGQTVTVVATATTIGTPSYVWSPTLLDVEIQNKRVEVANLPFLLEGCSQQYALLSRQADRWAAFVFLVGRDSRLLMVRTARRPELWQPVGGRGDARDRDSLDTAVREVYEETGIGLAPDSLKHIAVFERDVGLGTVDFWVAFCPPAHSIALQYGEILEARWVDVEQARQLPLYPACLKALTKLDLS
jgi:8-oxo-dGTP pyrophosphatase MutT (NUDIX family)